MEMTITLEITSDSLPHLRDLEHEFKAIHGLKVFLVEPRDTDAPVLISISIPHKDEQAELSIRRIAHTLYDFLHGSASETNQMQVKLVTIEGDDVDIMPLENEEIRQIISNAYAGQF